MRARRVPNRRGSGYLTAVRPLTVLLGAAGLAPLLVLPATASAATPVTTASRISLSGVGGIGIGERVSVVERRLGQDIDYHHGEVGGPGSRCGTGTLIPRALGVFVLGTGYRIASVTVTERGIATPSGVRVGDSVARLRRAYPGRLVRVRSFYEPRKANYEYRDGNRKLIFATNNVRVRQITTGRRPEVDYVEGCA